MLGDVSVEVNETERVLHIAAQYRVRLHEILGDALDSVVLYGSRARGEAMPGSDIDVLCIMSQPFDYGEMVLRTAKDAADLSLEHDVVISTAFVTRADYETRNTPFLMNVRQEALVV
jgi:predicted nucleotidyltransferase